MTTRYQREDPYVVDALVFSNSGLNLNSHLKLKKVDSGCSSPNYLPFFCHLQGTVESFRAGNIGFPYNWGSERHELD